MTTFGWFCCIWVISGIWCFGWMNFSFHKNSPSYKKDHVEYMLEIILLFVHMLMGPVSFLVFWLSYAGAYRNSTTETNPFRPHFGWRIF